jgi:hypothetical protein
MLGYLLRDTLLDALAAGPPYRLHARPNVPVVTYLKLLDDLERRGLITSGPHPALTEAGISEAKWFAGDQSLSSA